MRGDERRGGGADDAHHLHQGVLRAVRVIQISAAVLQVDFGARQKLARLNQLLFQHHDALLELLAAVVTLVLLLQLLPVDLVHLSLPLRLHVDFLQLVERLNLVDRALRVGHLSRGNN